jgi:catechol 2,3-dioxygenase-like lactoylglutathione lyase family enzyme
VISGIDHVLIAVRDLEAATTTFVDRLGLRAAFGGVHPRVGTHNAIVRFGLDYLELISVRDEAEARSLTRGAMLADFLGRREGLFGFAVATDDLDATLARVRAAGAEIDGPTSRGRDRPDGTRMSWRTANFRATPFGQVLPFIIQHDTPAAVRAGWAPAEGHPLGVTGVHGVTLCVPSIDDWRSRFEAYFGVQMESATVPGRWQARGVAGYLGPHRLELVEPSGDGPVQQALDDLGAGPYRLTLRVDDLDRSRAVLESRGTPFRYDEVRGSVLVGSAAALGAHIELLAG